MWLGGNDEFSSSNDTGRPFFWLKTGNKFKFSFWGPGNPDNYKDQEHCVHIHSFSALFQWNDAICNTKMGFICEDSHYVENCNKKIKSECDAVNNSNSNAFLKFESLQKNHLNELNSRLHNLEQLVQDGKSATGKLQTNLNEFMKQNEQFGKIWLENLQKQIDKLNAQITQFGEQINANIVETLNVK